MQYNNKPITRSALLALAIATGPVGAAVNSSLENDQTNARQAVIDELRRRCDSAFERQDSKKCHEENGKIICV
ncbi:hypothetical protein AEAC466_17270 [Asticcacaulis sp. AC466]|nr:hypothetical protein AEAC466_17270 [Asticcacaulis sp. AC466]